MCELFGISSARSIPCRDLLRTFFSHGVDHPHGWGLVHFYGGGVCVEKEPLPSFQSSYLSHRLAEDMMADLLIAHIRKASVGEISYNNSHPFIRKDASGRLWTLAHNGTIYESAELAPYAQVQTGSTDSERILYYLLDQINARQQTLHQALSVQERCFVVEEVIRTITPQNVVNLLIYDGEVLYVHMNRKDTLHLLRQENRLIVSTQPLTQDAWESAPLNTLLVFRQGVLVYTGKDHGNEYIKVESDENTAQEEQPQPPPA